MIDAIITANNAQSIVHAISNRLLYGLNDEPIRDIKLVDESKEVVILVSTAAITQELADVFWLGYKKALE